LANCKDTSNETKKSQDINPNSDVADREYEFTKRLPSAVGQSRPGLAYTMGKSNTI